MALNTAPISFDRARAVLGRRGVPTRVVLDVNDALDPCLEGQALCQEVKASVERINLAAGVGSRAAVVNEAGRLGYLATQYAAEFKRLADHIEGPGNDAA